MSGDEQLALSALSVFEGGFTHPAAQAAADISLFEISALVDKSMLLWQVDDGQGRFTIHNLTRTFAREKLARDPAHQEALLADHADYFGRTAALHTQQGYGKIDRSTELAWFEAELGNLRLALESLVKSAACEAAAELCRSLTWFARTRSWFADLPGWLQAADDTGPDAPGKQVLRAQIANSLGQIFSRLGQFEAAEQSHKRALALAQEHQAVEIEVDALLGLARLQRLQGNYPAMPELLKRALELAEASHLLHLAAPAYEMWGSKKCTLEKLKPRGNI